MKAQIYKVYKNVAENLLPPLSHSQFKEKGVLTPAEFVLAGDYLVQTCPTWSWEGGDASKRWAFLPPEKQYLITRNVPCLRRASTQLLYAQYDSPSATGEDVEGGDWVATTSTADVEEELDSFEELPDIQGTSGVVTGSDNASGGKYTIPDIDDDDEERQAKLRQAAHSGCGGGNGPASPTLGSSGGNEEGLNKQQEDRIPDISDLDLNEEETNAVTATMTAAPSSGVLATRTYDLLISYDNYYHVPRVWLIGYSEDRTPLTPKEVLEDVMSEYFSHRERKTVTVEPHPHRSLGGKVVSIHPCRHAETMHRLVAVVSGNGQSSGEEEQDEKEKKNEGDDKFKIEHYMVLFLKFISSVVPTIEYDYTMPAGM